MGGGGGGESLQVSVSFGKYENDGALSWEKWSTFSPNKYLEEVGKCSTPGSVAQKKAFFEAHYKKIAAMKAEAELLETTQIIDGSPRFEEAVNESSPLQVLESQPSESLNGSASAAEKLEEDESSSSLGLQVLESQPSESLNSSAAEKLEEAALVNAESMKLVQQHFQVELDPPQIGQQKINPKKEVKNSIGMKKKPASHKQTNKIPLKTSLIPKTPETPATRLSKPKPKPKETSSTSSLKKAGAPSSSKNKNQSLSETRHLSMSMNSDTASSSRRRSLFMEQMGDKDIVKRAFKTFQNRVNQLPSSPKQLPTKQKTSTSTAYQKENERSRKAAAAAEKVNPATWKSRDRSVGVDERALKSQETSERRKEFFKNLEEKSNARMASSKSKEVKDTEMKRVRQKAAKPMPMPKAQGLLKKTTGSSSSSCIL